MTILALTTSGSRAQVGLSSAEAPQTSPLILENQNPRQHSEWLHSAVQEILKQAGIQIQDLGGLALDLGPGSFTGVRVGFQLAQSLSFAAQLPVFATSSLAIAASSTPGRVIVANNAFRNLLYTGEFQDGEAVSEIQVEEIENFEKRFQFLKKTDPSLQLIGTFSGQTEPAANLLSNLLPNLLQMAHQAPPERWTKEWKLLFPLYIRQSEAEEKLKLR